MDSRPTPHGTKPHHVKRVLMGSSSGVPCPDVAPRVDVGEQLRHGESLVAVVAPHHRDGSPRIQRPLMAPRGGKKQPEGFWDSW